MALFQVATENRHELLHFILCLESESDKFDKISFLGNIAESFSFTLYGFSFRSQ